jgi:hypothetical protein
MNNQILEGQLISISDQCKFIATSIENVADQLARPEINKFTLIPPMQQAMKLLIFLRHESFTNEQTTGRWFCTTTKEKV